MNPQARQFYDDPSELRIFKNTHEAIVEEAVFEIVQKIRDGRRRITAFAKDHEAEFLDICTKKTKVALDRSLRDNKRELEQATQRIKIIYNCIGEFTLPDAATDEKTT